MFLLSPRGSAHSTRYLILDFGGESILAELKSDVSLESFYDDQVSRDADTMDRIPELSAMDLEDLGRTLYDLEELERENFTVENLARD